MVNNKFCAVCGEKQVEKHDFALKHYLEESLEGFTHFDNKFFRSAKLLITRPGLLSTYYSEGRRVNYIKPFQFFLICNLLFFLLAGKLNTFSRPFSTYYSFAPYNTFGTRPLINSMAHDENSLINMATTFNERMGTESKIYIVIFIPVFAAVCALLFIKKKKYFTENLIFSTHFFSFLLLFYLLFTLLVGKPFYWIIHGNFSAMFDTVASILSLLILGVYFGIAARRFYGVSNWYTAFCSVLVMVIFTITLIAYRMALFYMVIYTMHTT
nr:DUF3667 domain-containing protein [Mucilaginibacter segetis]